MTACTYRTWSSPRSYFRPSSRFCGTGALPLTPPGNRSVADEIVQPHIASLDYDGRRFNVSCRIAFDGIEYVGRLWFADESWDDGGLPDRGALPGRTREEVIAFARRLTQQDLMLR